MWRGGKDEDKVGGGSGEGVTGSVMLGCTMWMMSQRQRLVLVSVAIGHLYFILALHTVGVSSRAT